MAASSSAGRRWCNRKKGVTGGIVRRRCTNISLSVGSRCQLYCFLAPRKQYKLVEMKLLAQQRDLQAKVPDIEKCLTL